MPEAEGRGLLQSLQDHAERSAPTYAHVWRPHDVLIWDKRLGPALRRAATSRWESRAASGGS
jgi:alpha-ketoglutarate-dependent taurine dioxygenase